MKAKKDGKPKACRASLVPKDEPVLVSYYNTVTEGLDSLYDRPYAGDLEFVDRLKRVAALTLELAGAPKTRPLCPAEKAASARAAKERAEIEACVKRLAETADILIEATESGDDEAESCLKELFDAAQEAQDTSPFRFGKYRRRDHYST